jgi:hypothetical protein
VAAPGACCIVSTLWCQPGVVMALQLRMHDRFDGYQGNLGVTSAAWRPRKTVGPWQALQPDGHARQCQWPVSPRCFVNGCTIGRQAAPTSSFRPEGIVLQMCYVRWLSGIVLGDTHHHCLAGEATRVSKAHQHTSAVSSCQGISCATPYLVTYVTACGTERRPVLAAILIPLLVPVSEQEMHASATRFRATDCINSAA